jgi:hypothetical protein
MGKSVASPPAQTSPTTVAQQTTGQNAAIANYNQYVQNPNVYTPLGSTTTHQTGATMQIPDGNGGFITVPRYAQTTTLSPQAQGIFNTATNYAGNQLKNLTPVTSSIAGAGPIQTAIDPSQIDASLNSMLARWAPQQALRDQAVNTQLINEGFSPDAQSGTNAYNEAQLLNTQASNDAVNSFYNTAYGTALSSGQFRNAAQNQQYSQNANDAAFQNAASAQELQQAGAALGIGSGTVPAIPQYQSTPISQSNLGDIYGVNTSAAASEYAAQLQAQATQNAGLYGGIGNVLGAGLYGFAKSDRRVKTDIERIGTWHNGLPVYLFRYILDPLRKLYVGFMAQDVELFRPAAVVTLNGIKHVNYDLAVK